MQLALERVMHPTNRLHSLTASEALHLYCRKECGLGRLDVDGCGWMSRAFLWGEKEKEAAEETDRVRCTTRSG